MCVGCFLGLRFVWGVGFVCVDWGLGAFLRGGFVFGVFYDLVGFWVA